MGIASEVGIAGLTLGGGHGWLGGGHGLACDQLLSVKLVTADGQHVTASESENPDLFWGVRGGGGNFGIVISFEYRLHPVGKLLGGMPLYAPPAQAVRSSTEFSSTCPDEVAPGHRATCTTGSQAWSAHSATRRSRFSSSSSEKAHAALGELPAASARSSKSLGRCRHRLSTPLRPLQLRRDARNEGPSGYRGGMHWARECWEAMQPAAERSNYVNDLGEGEEEQRARGLRSELQAPRGTEEQVRPDQLLPPQPEHRPNGPERTPLQSVAPTLPRSGSPDSRSHQRWSGRPRRHWPPRPYMLGRDDEHVGVRGARVVGLGDGDDARVPERVADALQDV